MLVTLMSKFNRQPINTLMIGDCKIDIQEAVLEEIESILFGELSSRLRQLMLL